MSKKPYDLLVPEKYKHGGEERTKFHNVGVMFENENGGFSLSIPDGISISGRVLALPRKEKSD